MQQITFSHTPRVNQMLSCKEGGQWDKEHKLKEVKTGWGIVSKARTNPNSATQRRKRNRKGE